VLLPETANAIGLRFAGVGLALSRLLFDPVELFEEPERLFRRSASILPGFESLDEAPPGMGHAADMGCAIQCAPCGVAIAHQYAAVVTEQGLRVNLAAAGLVVEQHDWLGTVLAAAVRPHVRCAGGFPKYSDTGFWSALHIAYDFHGFEACLLIVASGPDH